MLLDQYPPPFWAAAILGVYLTGISKSGFAGGAGVVAIPLMATFIDPRLAVALLLPLLLFMDAFNLKHYWGMPNYSLLKPLLAGSLLGVLIGLFSFRLLNAAAIKLFVGIIGLYFAVSNLAHKSTDTGASSTGRLSLMMGAVAGFTSFIAHAGGPPLNGYLLKLRLGKNVFLATATFFLALTNYIKLPAYAISGQLTVQVGFFGILLLPIAWLGIKTGITIKDRISEAKYSLAMNLILLLISANLLIQALIQHFRI